MEHATLDTALELTPISREEIAQKKTSMPREDQRVGRISSEPIKEDAMITTSTGKSSLDRKSVV